MRLKRRSPGERRAYFEGVHWALQRMLERCSETGSNLSEVKEIAGYADTMINSLLLFQQVEVDDDD